MRVVLISCVSKKLERNARAEDLYISPLFKGAIKYAKGLSADKIYILSAKYGLITLDKEIETYNQTLNNMKDEEIKEWSRKIIFELRKLHDLERDEFIFLAGEKYRKHLLPLIKNYHIPLKGLGIGKQLKFYKEKNENLQ